MSNTDRQQRMDELRHYAHLIERQVGHAVRPYRADGYFNLLNKYGTSKDTTEQYHYAPEPVVPDEVIVQYYEGNGMFSKIIDAPSEEAIKHGFTLEGLKDQKTEDFYIEALDELDWEETFTDAIKWARLFGGSIAVMLINDGRGIDEPLDWDNIKSIDDIRVYDRSIIQPDYSGMFNYSPDDPFRTRGSRLGMPERYNVFSKYGNFTVHDSRCLVFQNGTLPENTTNSIYEMWGMPEYVRINKAIRDAEVAHGSAVKLLDRSIQAVYKMKDLAAELATEQGEDRVLRRLQTIDMARGLLNSIVIDNEGEEYDFRQFAYTGVSQVIDTTCNYLSALTSIPQTILFGRSPAGMNATGHGDLENWYNYLERIQKRMVRKNLRYLLSIVFQAGVATGEIDKVPTIDVKFNPLWSLTETEQASLDQQKATTEQAKAQTAQIYVEMQALDPSEVRKKLAESGDFDVETMLDDYTPEELEENAPKPEEQGMGGDPMGGLMGMMGGGGTPQGPQGMPQGGEPRDNPVDGGNAPIAAPTATKLPEDMSQKEQAEATQIQESNLAGGQPSTKNTKPVNANELRAKVLAQKSGGVDKKDGGPGSGIKGHKTFHPEEEMERQRRAAEENNRKFNVGNIDLTKRPKVSSETMAKAGYETDKGSISTVYSSYDFFWQGGEENGKWVCVHYTPITQDGKVYSADDMYDYISQMAQSGDALKSDAGDRRMIMSVEDVPCSEQEIDEFMRTGQATEKLDAFMKQADQWDEDVHNAQAELYTETNSDSDVDEHSDKEKFGGVGVVVVSGGKILCGTRNNDTGYGLIGGPGGHIENGETAEDAAVRETYEEFGITPRELVPLGTGPQEDDTGYTPMVYLCTEYSGTPKCADLEMTNPRFETMENLLRRRVGLHKPFLNGVLLLKKKLDDTRFHTENTDADRVDDDWVTINGTHVLIDENGQAQSGGKLKGMNFSNAKSTTSRKSGPDVRGKFHSLSNRKAPSKESIQGGKESWHGIKLVYDPTMQNEARNLTSEIHVSDKFFTYSEEQQKHILDHEAAHNLSDEMISNVDWNELQSTFLHKRTIDERAVDMAKAANLNVFEDEDGSHYVYESIYGDLGSNAIHESTTQAITEFMDDPEKLKGRSEAAYNAVAKFLEKRGYAGYGAEEKGQKASSKTELSQALKPMHDDYDYDPDYDFEDFQRKNIKRMREIYKEHGGFEAVRDEYYRTRLQSVTKDFKEVSRDEADEVLYDNLRPGTVQGWFREYNHEVKPALVWQLTQSPEVHNAALNIMYQNYKYKCSEDNVTPLPFEEFLVTPIKMYRGGSGKEYKTESEFSSYSLSRNAAIRFTYGESGHDVEKVPKPGSVIYEAEIRPIDTYGSVFTNGESEVLVPRGMAPNKNRDSNENPFQRISRKAPMEYTRLKGVFERMNNAARKTHADASDKVAEWITVNGTHIPIGPDGDLKGKVGDKIENQTGKGAPQRKPVKAGGFHAYSAKKKEANDKITKIVEESNKRPPEERQSDDDVNAVAEVLDGLSVGSVVKIREDANGRFIKSDDGSWRYEYSLGKGKEKTVSYSKTDEVALYFFNDEDSRAYISSVARTEEEKMRDELSKEANKLVNKIPPWTSDSHKPLTDIEELPISKQELKGLAIGTTVVDKSGKQYSVRYEGMLTDSETGKPVKNSDIKGPKIKGDYFDYSLRVFGHSTDDKLVENVRKTYSSLPEKVKQVYTDAFREVPVSHDNFSYYDSLSRSVSFGLIQDGRTFWHEFSHALQDRVLMKVKTQIGEKYVSEDTNPACYIDTQLMQNDGDQSDFKTMMSIIPFRQNEDGGMAEPKELLEHAETFNKWFAENCKFDGAEVISDVVSSLTHDRIYATYFNGGHDASYWSQPFWGHVPSNQSSEYWAEYCELKINHHTEALAMMKRLTPKRYEATEKAFREVFGDEEI